MKLSQIWFAMLVIVVLFFLVSCEGEGDETEVSRKGDNESHFAGQNCMNCHVAGGSGEGKFTVAGTVYQANLSVVFPNTLVKLHSQANGLGNLIATIEVDALGNFYTTKSIIWGAGLYASVEGNNTTLFMATKLIEADGACSRCHGVANLSVIFAD